MRRAWRTPSRSTRIRRRWPRKSWRKFAAAARGGRELNSAYRPPNRVRTAYKEDCVRQGIPVAIVLAGGYAESVEDTITINANTAAVAKEVLEKVRGGGAWRA